MTWAYYDTIIDTIINYQVHGLKPSTLHKLYILNYDISAACIPKGGTVGSQIITDAQGKCEFILNLKTLQNLQGVSSTAQRYRQNLWAEIQAEIMRRASVAGTDKKTKYTLKTWSDYSYETVLKNTGGDSFAKGSFKFFLISTTTTPVWHSTGNGENDTGYYTSGTIWNPVTQQYDQIPTPPDTSGMYSA